MGALEKSTEKQCLLTNLDEDTLSDLIRTCDIQEKYYEEEASQLEALFSLVFPTGSKELEEDPSFRKLNEYQKYFQVDELTTNSILMAYADSSEAERNNHSALLKFYYRKYVSFVQNIAQRIEALDGTTQEQILKFSQDSHIADLEKKTAAYETNLKRLHEKYPDLLDPNFNIIGFSERVMSLMKVFNRKKELESELDHYKGLKPNLDDANLQLLLIKKELDKMNRTLQSNTDGLQ